MVVIRDLGCILKATQKSNGQKTGPSWVVSKQKLKEKNVQGNAWYDWQWHEVMDGCSPTLSETQLGSCPLPGGPHGNAGI